MSEAIRIDWLMTYAADCARHRHDLPGNFSLPLKQAGLIKSWHQGWGFYAFEFTPAGRTFLENQQQR